MVEISFGSHIPDTTDLSRRCLASAEVIVSRYLGLLDTPVSPKSPDNVCLRYPDRNLKKSAFNTLYHSPVVLPGVGLVVFPCVGPVVLPGIS